MNLPGIREIFRRANPVPPPDLRCIDTIAPKGKWDVMIRTKRYNLDYLRKNPIWDGRRKIKITDGILILDKPIVLNSVEDLIFYEKINAKPLINFELMQQRCIENSKLFYGLAENLSGRSLEAICKKVFKKEGIAKEFVENFYTEFLPTYFKRPYNWFSVSLLVRARVAYPDNFKILADDLIGDIEVPSSLMLDYASTLDIDKQTELMKIITKGNMNNVQFCHNLKLILYLFTNCEKTERIYEFILTHLEMHAVFCSSNKDYGRLMFTFMNNLSAFRGLRTRSFPAKKLIDIHGSVYKASCVCILDDMVSVMLDLHPDPEIFVNRRRFFIPREPAPSFL